ncbi:MULTISPECIES: FG-GAP-like repeat-containing protein [Actinomadura]|uniref:FG-GAP-like repeat-containing protein n=1 Tax=Actinomadura yumaensis TaxID=111807 RepID=A0ABW2CZJ8_9ACTN|nr:FG-GAP-like repeat-containing protein [Actinomadura sp. J1-007]MWK35126.1 hypothetical protein [Actinomadura sp. J1-007]
MRTRFLPAAVAASTVAALGGLGMAVLAPAASAAAPAKPFDFNGDGYRDLAIGSPNGKVSGKKAAGFVTVTFGSASGLNTAKRQVLHQDTAGVGGAAEANDHFGYAVSSADLDRDGYAELVVGVPDEDADGKTDVGAFTVFWGTKSGLSTQAATVAPQDGATGSRAGLSLAGGDFNRGGYGDFAYTGATGWGWYSYEPPAARTARANGAAFVQHAMPAPRKRAGARAAAAPRPVTARVQAAYVTNSTYPGVLLGWNDPGAPEPGDRNVVALFERGETPDTLTPTSAYSMEPGSLASGDFNGDGFGDVAIGRPAVSDAHPGGEVQIIPGTAQGFGTDVSVIDADTPGVPGGVVSGARFGADLAAGDVNKDGKADLAIGVPGYKSGSAASAGGTYLLFGSATGVTGTGTQWLSQSTAGVPGGSEANDRFGTQVTLLDHTKDGNADLVVGAPGENGTEGAITFVKGRANGVVPVTGAVSYGPGTFKVGGLSAQLGLWISD